MKRFITNPETPMQRTFSGEKPIHRNKRLYNVYRLL